MKLSAIVLSFNEESNIPACLALLSWADEILVIDSGSTDQTVELSKKHGARVVQHPLVDFATQRNFALQQAHGDWVFFVDADERVTQELADEIRGLFNQNPSPAVYRVPRYTFFFGRRLRFGDSLHDAPVRLFPRERVNWTQPVHEQIVTDLSNRMLKHPLLHYSTRNWEHYQSKLRSYIPLELITMQKNGSSPGWRSILLRPPAKFLYLYFWKLGVLDGIAGLSYAILSAYYTLLKYWKFKFGGFHAR